MTGINNSTKNEFPATCLAGQKQNGGFYICENCGQKLYLNEGDILMQCPRCDNKTFTKE